MAMWNRKVECMGERRVVDHDEDRTEQRGKYATLNV
jgi:hypothetical protein